PGRTVTTRRGRAPDPAPERAGGRGIGTGPGRRPRAPPAPGAWPVRGIAAMAAGAESSSQRGTASSAFLASPVRSTEDDPGHAAVQSTVCVNYQSQPPPTAHPSSGPGGLSRCEAPLTGNERQAVQHSYQDQQELVPRDQGEVLERAADHGAEEV